MKKLIQLSIIVAAFFCISAQIVRSQEPDEGRQPQEVFQTELVYAQEKGETQVSLSPTFAKNTKHNSLKSPLTIEYGLTNKWQIEIEWDGPSMRRERGDERTAQGTGDLRLGTKYSFMNMRGSKFHSAVGMEFGLPTGDVEKELSEGVIEFEPYVILARDLPALNGAQLFTQIGLGFMQRVKGQRGRDDNEAPAHEFSWNTGFFIPFRKMFLTGELNWQTNRWNRAGDENELYITPGLVWQPSRAWEMGIGFPVGLNHDADHIRGIVKMTYEF